MPHRFAVCDDNEADAAFVEALLSRWAAQRQLTIQTESFPSAESFLFRYEECKGFDVLLLDIEMGRMDGVTLAKRLRRENETVQIVFITGYADYIAEGYEVSALHYLIKPVREDKLFAVLDRAMERRQKDERALSLESNGEALRIPLRAIRYIDVQGNYATLHAERDVTVKKTLSELGSMLDERFFRVGRSSIVNLSCISRVIKRDIYLDDGSTIPLPRGAYERVNRAIIDMR